MKEYLQMVRQVMSRFLKAKVLQVAWGQNRHAGSLATLASSITEEVPQIGINKIVRSNFFYCSIYALNIGCSSVPIFMIVSFNY